MGGQEVWQGEGKESREERMGRQWRKEEAKKDKMETCKSKQMKTSWLIHEVVRSGDSICSTPT